MFLPQKEMVIKNTIFNYSGGAQTAFLNEVSFAEHPHPEQPMDNKLSPASS